jgi:hypothetical protein
MQAAELVVVDTQRSQRSQAADAARQLRQRIVGQV